MASGLLINRRAGGRRPGAPYDILQYIYMYYRRVVITNLQRAGTGRTVRTSHVRGCRRIAGAFAFFFSHSAFSSPLLATSEPWTGCGEGSCCYCRYSAAPACSSAFHYRYVTDFVRAVVLLNFRRSFLSRARAKIVLPLRVLTDISGSSTTRSEVSPNTFGFSDRLG